MTFAPFAESQIDLTTDRILAGDAKRQMRTAAKILAQLDRQPGVILADEVGMGKTFVAMAVAASVIIDNPNGGPVVVMVPSSLQRKWPTDWKVFRKLCLRGSTKDWIHYGEAHTGVEFLKRLDDRGDQRKHIIFLTHGALHRAPTDGWVKLAVLKRAFKGRSSLGEQRAKFGRFAAGLLQMKWAERRTDELLGDLIERPYADWRKTIHRLAPELKEEIDDDPVPEHLADALAAMKGSEFDGLVDELRKLPLRWSDRIDERLKTARKNMSQLLKKIWERALQTARIESPLLILDEAHHLKNPSTRLASLFVEPDVEGDVEQFRPDGALAGKFDRMLFLTATPFQLGHAELIRVLDRFEGIAWHGHRTPQLTRENFRTEIRALGESLDGSQAAALRLDRAWGRLTEDDLRDTDGRPITIDAWWEKQKAETAAGASRPIVGQLAATSAAMRDAEGKLRPWVVRNLKPPYLADAADIARRRVLPGAAIRDESRHDAGLAIDGDALLPFLLAGRAQTIFALSERGRAKFAEGLASSFEAYGETRSGRARTDEESDSESDATSQAVAGDTMPELGSERHDSEIASQAARTHSERRPSDSSDGSAASELEWYLSCLDAALGQATQAGRLTHPKIEATVERAMQLWRDDEKVLIFCHYRATGRALRRHISARLHEDIIRLGAEQLPHLARERIPEELEQLGARFFDEKGSLRAEVNSAVGRIIAEFDALARNHAEQITTVVRRFVRTPSFLVRHFELNRSDHAAAFADSMNRTKSGQSLIDRIRAFCQFLDRLIGEEQEEYLNALERIQTGTHVGREDETKFDPSEVDEEVGRPLLLPNVRLAYGRVTPETRRRLMLAFNTPLFPEILIASSVLAEGVDLHLNCRHVIHHDLCWNPSTLEQRTGRVDRLGSKAELCKSPIHVYLPYVAATQDEKMFRVVRDRERWFQIVLGESFAPDESSTERLARRIPLPDAVQRELTFRLQDY